MGITYTNCRLLYIPTSGHVIYVGKNCLTSGILIDSPVYSSPGSQLQIRITPQIFEKIRNRFWACPLGPGEVV